MQKSMSLEYEPTRFCLEQQLHYRRNVRTSSLLIIRPLQGYLAHKKLLPPRTLQWAYAQGPMVVLGGVNFFMSEVPLYDPAPKHQV